MDLRRQLSVNKAASDMNEFDKAEEKLRQARYLARTVFPYFAGPLTAMSIKMTNDAVFPEPKEFEDSNGNIIKVPKPKHCAGEITDANGKEFWLNPTFGVDEKMRTYIHPMAVNMWIEEAKEVSPSKPCATCGKTHHHPLAYVAGVFVHEMWHPLRKHGRRANNYKTDFNHRVWNVAADCEINDNIREFVKSTSMDRLCLPPGGQFPDMYELEENLLAEEYYTTLMQKIEQEQQSKGQGQPQKGKGNNKGKGQPQKGKGKGQPQDGEGDGDTLSQMPQGGRCGSGADGQKKDYEDGQGDGQNPNQQNTKGQQGDPQQGQGDPNEGVGEGEIDAMSRRVAQDIQDQAAKNPGSVPAGLVRWAGEILGPPKYDWRQELRLLIRYFSNRYKAGNRIPTYAKPSRVSIISDYAVVLPKHKDPIPEIAIVIDTSGSMAQDQIRLALEETEGLCKLMKVPLTLIDVDTEARVNKVKNVSQARLLGGGGTDMRVGIKKAIEGHKPPSLVIVMTDGYSPFEMEQPRNTNVIICLVGDNVTAECVMPWMKVVYVNDEGHKGSPSKRRR